MAATSSPWAFIALASAPSERRTPPPMQIAPELVEACRRGDRGALDVVFRAHAQVLERLLARLVGPTADVEDLLQETFAAAMEAFPRFRGEASVRTWLHRIAVHIAGRELRHPRRRRTVSLEDVEAPGSSDPVVSEAMASQMLARLYVHLDALDPVKRIALVLHVIEDHSIADVAALTGASRAATKSRIFWAKRALLKRLRRDPLFADVRGEP